MKQTSKIKCPFCGTVLTVKYFPGIEAKNVICPVCRHTNRFANYHNVDVVGEGSATAGYRDDSPTEVPPINRIMGSLVHESSGETFALKEGRNTIGRNTDFSTADIRIDTGADRAMSREHIVVEVKETPEKGFVHCLYLAKEKVNATYVNDQQIYFGDRIILSNGDEIKLPDATLRFDLPDPDATCI